MNELEEMMAEAANDNSKLPFKLVDKQGPGYIAVVRFRNKEDYFEFADLIKQPKLKVYSKSVMREIMWPIKEPENSLFD
jgi:hypothetical protein